MLAGAVLVAAGLALWLSFDYGRRAAGFSSAKAAADRSALDAQLADLQRQVRELRVQLAGTEAARLSQLRERSEVSRTIGELQAQLAIAQRDLQFYRGIANPQAPVANAVIVQQMSVREVSALQRRYAVRMALARESKQEGMVKGTVALALEGTSNGSAARLELGQQPFNFRYFGNIEHPITLPGGFVAERLNVEVRPDAAGMTTYKKTYVWSPGGQDVQTR